MREDEFLFFSKLIIPKLVCCLVESEKELIDRFRNLQNLKKDIDADLKEIRELIIRMSFEKDSEVLFGSDMWCSVKEYDKVVYPEDKELLLRVLKEKGDYDKVSGVIYPRLSSKILKGGVSSEVVDMVKKEKAYRLVLSRK